MKANHTPKYLKARTAKGLEREMLKNNIARKEWHQYQVVHDGKEWFAWYYVDMPQEKELEGLSKPVGQ
jgi:hypothetical protein